MQEPTLDFELSPQELHPFIRDIIRLVHMESGAQAEIILPTVLGTMAAACQDSFDVQLREGQVNPVSLYTIILAPSGARKTTVHNIVTKSIKEVEKAFHAEFRKNQDFYTKEHSLWRIKFKAAEKRYRKTLEMGSDPAKELLLLKSVQDIEPIKPKKKQLTINDSTPEALIKVLAEGHPSLSIISDEAGGLFDGALFRKSPMFNTLWSGQRINSVRVSRQEYSVEDPKVGLLAMLQSEVYDRYLFSHGEYSRNSGFMARCLLVDLKQVRKPYNLDAHSIFNFNALNEFHILVRQYIVQGVNRRIRNEPRKCIALTDEAAELYEYISKIFNEMIKPGAVLEAYDDLGARFVEQSIRIAAVMQVFITPGSINITHDVLKSAIHIMNWYLDHMIAKLNCTRKRSDAEKLEDWLEDHLITNKSFDFRRNDIIKKGPYSVRNIDRLLAALKKLEAFGKVQQFKQGNANYVRFIGSKTSPYELGEQLGLPNWAIGSMSMGKLPFLR